VVKHLLASIRPRVHPQYGERGAKNWWLIHIILATGKAEIWRILVKGQPGQKVSETLSQQKAWCHVPVIPARKA
jgi:hypothetical protein